MSDILPSTGDRVSLASTLFGASCYIYISGQLFSVAVTCRSVATNSPLDIVFYAAHGVDGLRVGLQAPLRWLIQGLPLGLYRHLKILKERPRQHELEGVHFKKVTSKNLFLVGQIKLKHRTC